MTNETNKVAIVTGASRGIGAAVAERLAADGFTVVINYSGDTKSAEALARKIEGKGGRALTAKADVSDPNAVRGMFDAAEAAFGGVDVLVNNAGIMKLAKIADSDDALFDQQVAINLKGSFNAMREAARRLRNGGRIVNFSTSVVGTQARDLRNLYRDQGRDRSLDGDPGQGDARPLHHRQRRGAGPDRDGSVPQRQIARSDRPLREDESAGAARHAAGYRRRGCRSSLAPMAHGSTARCCAPMAAWSDQVPRSQARIGAFISRG